MLPQGARATGRVAFDGRDVLTLPEAELRNLRGKEISMVFQSPGTSFNPVFTIGSQLEQVARRHLGLRGAAKRDVVVETLGKVELPDPARTMRFYPHELSGGMLQRAMIAMAILCRPRLLIADEPTTALDASIAEQILRLLRSLQREYGFAVFFISHDLDLVGDFCDRIAVLYAGRVVETGTARELLERPRHPYTKALLEALPRHARPGRDAAGRAGNVPTGLDDPTGCSFAAAVPTRGGRLRRAAAAARTDRGAAKRRVLPLGGDVSALVEITGLVKEFPGRRRGDARVRAVDGVDLSIDDGTALGLVGESGSGKTTVARCLLGLTPISGGTITYAGGSLRREVQLVFQQPVAALDPRMRVEALVAEPLRAQQSAAQPVARDRVARGGRALPGAAAALSARAFGRPGSARRDRARPGDEAAAPRARRADVRARHRRAGADSQPAARAARRASASPFCSSRTTSRSSVT